jgi:hypothetical protein
MRTTARQKGASIMGIRKSVGKNKKSKAPAAATAVNRAAIIRKSSASKKRTP